MGEARNKERRIKEEVGLWVVGFFDLMGFKRELTAVNPSPVGATEAERVALYRSLQTTVTRRLSRAKRSSDSTEGGTSSLAKRSWAAP